MTKKIETTVDIKKIVKKVFGLKTTRDNLISEIKSIDAQLAEYGITTSSLSIDEPASSERKEWPELTVETVTAFIKGNGGGAKVGEIRDNFGPSFYKWSKENVKHFKVIKDGIKRIWSVKE